VPEHAYDLVYGWQLDGEEVAAGTLTGGRATVRVAGDGQRGETVRPAPCQFDLNPSNNEFGGRGRDYFARADP
jgi:hypothetical protein